MKKLTETQKISIEDMFRDVIEEIKEVYLHDSRPWILGYSGGKDSTTVLQLVWTALLELPEKQRIKTIHVISSDTLIETPLIRDFLIENHKHINSKAAEANIPLTAQILFPRVDDTFWVNMIGRGYPAPNQRFRWCTNRLKIKTSTRYIRKQISTYGEVMLVLGTRIKESGSRARLMKDLVVEGEKYSYSNQFSAAFAYSPIREWGSWEVWQYLMKNTNPWGGDNEKLVQMYRDAEGECPFVVDDKSPPCGESRFGCWTCTLVKTDKSLSSLIDSGIEWLQPFLDFRDYLVRFHDPDFKHYIRDYKLRRGYVAFKSNESGDIIRGPYYFWLRQALLHYLLWTEKKIRLIGPDPNVEIIGRDEVDRIRQIWRTEESDWEDSVPLIYQKVYDDVYWTIDDNNPFNRLDKEKIIQLSNKYSIPSKLVTRLLDLELQTQGMSFRSSIFKKMDKIFNEEWRPIQTVIENYQEKKR